MATPKSQRLGILIIMIVMVVGTIGSFFVMMLSSDNDAADKARQQELMKQYQDEVAVQEKELSDKYYPVLSQYAGRVGEFDRDSVTEIAIEDLLVGTGEEVTDETTYSAYYIGWNPKGKIFDQSIQGEALKAPIPGQGLIPGWSEAVKGMKLGGVREITIPSDKAYVETGQGDDIPPNTPIKFIVLAIETPPQVQPSDELLKAMGYM